MGTRAQALILAAGIVAGLTACTPTPTPSPDAPPSRSQASTAVATAAVTMSSTPAPVDAGSVAVVPYREPGDHAHRNYCGAGAARVLLSAWLPAPPDIEMVARAVRLKPDLGVTTPGLLAGINAYIDPIVAPRVGRSWYHAERITEVAVLEQRLRADLTSADAERAFGHTAPVIVSTMTRTMPHWDGWQATHTTTIYAVDLRHGDPALDTVTYTETPSYEAGYHGSGTETSSLATLWAAMQAYLQDQPQDPLNVIS